MTSSVRLSFSLTCLSCSSRRKTGFGTVGVKNTIVHNYFKTREDRYDQKKVKTTKIYNWMAILYDNDVFSNSNCLHDIPENKHTELPLSEY